MKYFLAGYLLDFEENSGNNKHIILDINDSVN
jgi:hypothetical protein